MSVADFHTLAGCTIVGLSVMAGLDMWGLVVSESADVRAALALHILVLSLGIVCAAVSIGVVK